MAELIPPLENIDLETLPRGEHRVLETLRALDFPGLQVYYSMPLLNYRSDGLRRGEADFVLFHPSHGLLVWEVKGGGVHFENNSWYSTNAQGTHRIKDPTLQLNKAIASLHQNWRKPMGESFRLPTGRNLVFPETEASGVALPPGLERMDLIDRHDLAALDREALIRQFKRWPNQDALPISAMEQTRLVTKVLNPSFQLVPSPGSDIDWIEDRLVQLSNQQKWALELLRFVPQLTITGGAGTGKTLLARQKAQDLLDEGKRVLVLCFNQNLGESLRSGLGDALENHPQSLTVATFHDFARDLIERTGGNWPVPEDPAEQPDFYENRVPEMLEEALQRDGTTYDALVVDEAQDFAPMWLLTLAEALTETPSVCLFADPSQNLYGRDFELPTDIFAQMPAYPFHLSYNCRNAREIAQWLNERFEAASLPAEDLPSSGIPVTEHTWKSVDEQAEQLLAAWDRLRERGIEDSQITVLSPYRPEKSAGIRALGEARPKNRANTSTINAFKGLQSPYVLMVDMDTSAFANRDDVWYVGATRATVSLQVFRKAVP